jgi:hypothetical protein
VTVGGKRYLQVIEPNERSISVVQSFGEYNIENWLRANQFANSYNQLRDLAQSRPTNGSDQDFLRAALATFGVILGATIVASLLGVE